MLQPLKEASGKFMAATTRPWFPLRSRYRNTSRAVGKSIAWAPARMTDAAEEQCCPSGCAATSTIRRRARPTCPQFWWRWRRDYTPTPRDYTRQVADREMVIIPTDLKERMFGLRPWPATSGRRSSFSPRTNPRRTRWPRTAGLFLDATPNRRFTARYTFASQPMDWPVQVELPDVLP